MTQRGLAGAFSLVAAILQAGGRKNESGRVPKPSDAAMQPRCGDMKDRLIPVVPQYNPAYKA